jgi:Xaa-Pro aminopeptidase
MRLARTAMIGRGATGVSHITFSFGGANPEIAIAEPLGADTLVTLDLGAIIDGYCSDNRRYAYTGDPPDGLVQRYETMVSIVDRIGSLLIPGTTYAELYERTLALYDENGVQPLARFSHIGHNIGLETEERWLDQGEDVIEPGMAINVELYTRLDTGEQIGNEETYFVSSSGPERISTLPRQIRVVR